MAAPANDPPALKGADPIIHSEDSNGQCQDAYGPGSPRPSIRTDADWVLWQQVLESAKAVCLGSTTSQYGPPTQQDQEAPASGVVHQGSNGGAKVECEGSKALVFFGVLREHILLFVDLCQLSLGTNTEGPDLFNDTAMDRGDEPPTNQKREGNTLKNRLARLQAQIHHHDASFAPGCEPYNEYFTDAIDYLTTTLIDVLPEPADDYRMKPILIALVARLAARLKQMNRHLHLPAPELQKESLIAQFCSDLIPLACWDWLGYEIDSLQRHVVHLFREAALNLPNSLQISSPTDLRKTLEMYDCSITKEVMVLFKGYDGEIGTGSHAGLDRLTRHIAAMVYRKCSEAAEQPRPLARVGSRSPVTIECSMNIEPCSRIQGSSRRELFSLESIVAVLIPYSMVSGAFTVRLDQLVTMCSISSKGLDNNFVTYYTHRLRLPSLYKICVNISKPRMRQDCNYISRVNHISMIDRNVLLKHVDVNQLMQSEWNRRARIRERLAVSQTLEDDSSAVDDMSNWSNEKRRKIFEMAQDEYNTWVVDENSIVVPYKQYAWSFLGIAATLVIGGLAFGFSIGERIEGVDPFNISVFCWGLAAFMLVLVKAVRVEYWSWHRFLRGEVACRSITEVVSVTGMNPQVLLVILLRLDDRMFLQTRGPFNTMFRRHTDDPQSGFSINVPIKATTAFEGTHTGDGARRAGPGIGTPASQHLGNIQLRQEPANFENGLHCRDVLHPGSWAPDKSVPCYRLSRGDMKVVRVLDVYGADSYLY
ncbi:conserved hypothetical protein [Verticillium alfalfae VaMs.102]|uniref:Uncharacterized protein n=1 Tax=Verticillium alfalfae (strain VaMs.102 / ATCC MYA-4576 / FGSC 10136) TaxID=526221 RepID=C9SHH8_VERA1|nr:conserved hypothetical protein [Verticillium alfalfae VaMs.102]EEY18401.1 conserved hypothetical protein [Verticillium alfalfae VaMs.102]